MADSGQPNPGYQEGQAQAEGGGAMAESSAPRQRHPSLQDQMNKVMNPVEKFPLLPSTSPVPAHGPRVKQLHVDEDDYQAHRNVHLHVHHPLKTHIHRRYSSPSFGKDFPHKGHSIPEEKEGTKPTKEAKRPRVEPPQEWETPCEVTMATVDVEDVAEDVEEKTEEKVVPSEVRKASIVRTDSYEAAVRGFPDLLVDAAAAADAESLTSTLRKEPSLQPTSSGESHDAPPSYHECVQEVSPEGSRSDDLEEKTPKEPSKASMKPASAEESVQEPETKESLKSSGSAKAALAKVLARKDSERESDSEADSSIRPSPSQIALLRGDISRDNSSKELKSILKNSSALKNREDSQKSLDKADLVAAGDAGDADITAPQKKATFIIGGDLDMEEDEETVFDLVKTADQDAQAGEADDRVNEIPHFREPHDKDSFKKKSHRHHHGHHHSHHHGHHHHHHHHHHHKKVPTPMDRLRIGSMTKMDAEIYHKMPTEHEEARQLLTPDLNEMISHRLEDVPGRRRHRIKKPNVSSMVYIGKQSKPQKKISVEAKKTWDKSPHEVFVELDTLHQEQQELVWCESARWIKFEEDVQQGAERWGKPHVSSLSFHSLLELRKGLEQGSVLLDLNETELPNIMHHVVENMIITDQVRPEDRGDIMRALLLKHSHLYQKKRHKVIPYNFSSGSLLGFLGHREDSMASTSQYSGGLPSATSLDTMEAGLKVNLPDNNNQHTVPVPMTPPPLHKSPTAKSTLSTKSAQMDIKSKVPILKKIPEDAEATTVLVGAVDFLEKPTMAFVRLARGAEIGTLTAVPLPVRFLFVLLGPSSGATDYNEIGRSISTLMANETFHEMAYRADDRSDLLRGINEFLGDSIVLPPGDFDRRLLEPIARLQRKRLRKRKRLLEETEGLVKRTHEPEDDPLKRTGECFGGLKRDIQRRFPYYVSDFVDGLNFQCLMAFFFIFFTCVTPVITFGGLLSDKTHNHIGVSEMIIATAISGGLFSLLAGQPIIIIAATGPFLVYDQSLYEFCESNGIEFMTWRLWIGLWILVICIITVAFEGGVFVRYVTRFTEEVFAFLISFIFIYEVFKFLSKVYTKNPLCSDCYYYDTVGAPVYNRNGSLLVNTTYPTLDGYVDSRANDSRRGPMPAGFVPGVPVTYPPVYADPDGYEAKEIKNQPNTALMSTILCFGTFFMAYFLRKFKNSKFLSRGARRGLGDFGLLISIVVMVCIDYFFQDVYTQKLEVPDGFTPTDPKLRSWIINPMGRDKTIQVWAIFAAVIPAFLVYILLFIEIQITEMIINKKENNLKKGSGYHLDLLLICGTVAISGFFGLPWMCAATVRSVSHFESLTVYSKTHAPGEKPKLLSVKEQRLTNLLVHIMMGITMTLQPVLRRIPLAVLFGVFLYLGITSLAATQIFERIGLMFMPPKHHPSNVRYVRKVKTRKIHIFTVIQLVFITLLWIVKSTQAALAFPFLLILLIPFRNHVMKRFYTETEMEALDAESEGDDDDDDVDEYDTARLPF